MTTRFAGTLEVELLSPLSVGGYTAPPSFVDAASALGANGEPVIPASTLRGALREALTRLARGRGTTACTVDEPCEDDPCVVCRVFGASGPDRPALGTAPDASPQGVVQDGGLRFSDAQGDRVDPTLRTGVGIDRKRRAAVPEVLFDRQVADRPGLRLKASFEAKLSTEDFELLKEASLLVNGVGNSRSRGYGEIRLAWQEAPENPTAAIRTPKDVSNSVLLVTITAREPLVLGGLPPTGSVERSLGHIRGSVLRGAIATALVEAGVDDSSPAFQRLFVDESTCLRFSDAGPAPDGRLPRPRALSLLECRRAHEPDHHGRPGAHLDQLLLTALTEQLLAQGGAPEPATCAVCGSLLKSAGRGWDEDPDRELVTRLARDVRTGSAMPGMLYGTERIRPRARFVGTVAGADEEALELLGRLGGATVRLGRGRNRGQGTVAIELSSEKSLGRVKDLRSRRDGTLRDIAGWLAAAGTAGHAPPVERWVPVLARSDIRVPPEAASEHIAAEVFGRGARCVTSFQGSGQRSGWDLRSGSPVRPLAPVVTAGSAWLFELEAEPDLEAVARAEREGVGEDRHLGCGQIELFSSVFTKGAQR